MSAASISLGVFEKLHLDKVWWQTCCLYVWAALSFKIISAAGGVKCDKPKLLKIGVIFFGVSADAQISPPDEGFH
jgi:hypothetical protein